MSSLRCVRKKYFAAKGRRLEPAILPGLRVGLGEIGRGRFASESETLTRFATTAGFLSLAMLGISLVERQMVSSVLHELRAGLIRASTPEVGK